MDGLKNQTDGTDEVHVVKSERHERQPMKRFQTNRLFSNAVNAINAQKGNEKKTLGLMDKPHQQKLETENSYHCRDFACSNAKTTIQNRNNQDCRRSDFNGKGRSDWHEPNMCGKDFNHKHFKRKGPLTEDFYGSNVQYVRKMSSQENRDWSQNSNNQSTNRIVSYQEKVPFLSNQNKQPHLKISASTQRHQLSRNQSSLVDFNNSGKNNDQSSFKNNRLGSEEMKNSFGHGNSTTYYKGNFSSSPMLKSKVKGEKDVHKSYAKRDRSPKLEAGNHPGFSFPHKDLYTQKYNKSITSNNSHVNGQSNTLKNHHHLPSDNWDTEQPCIQSNALKKDHNWQSDNWDTEQPWSSFSDGWSSISDEPKASELEIPVRKDTNTPNFGFHNNANLLQTCNIFPCDVDPGSPQIDFFSSTNCQPIPAPRPARVNATYPTDALSKEDKYPAPDSTIHLIGDTSDDVSDYVSDDDSDDLSSKNLHSFGSTYAASSEAETSDSESSINSDESDCVLDAEKINAITDYLRKVENDQSVPVDVAKKVFYNVNRVLKSWAIGNTVVLYGSYLSGLALSTSNINLALKSDQPLRKGFLLSLQKALSKGLSVYDVVPFEEEVCTRDSKVCFYEPDSGISCEIMYMGSTVSNHSKTSNLLKCICKYDPRIKTLIIASRVWAETCAIHETENGQLHPSNFALLVVHFLQQIEPPVLPLIDVSSEDWGLKPLHQKNKSEIGELWFDFLKYYSHTFDWLRNVVTVHCKEEVLKHTLCWENWLIAIQDPNSMKNVAESVVSLDNAEYIFSCFKSYYDYFLTDYTSSDSSSGKNSPALSDQKWKYTFKESRVNLPSPVYCEECDDEICERCQEHFPTNLASLDKLPELNEISMKCIDKALLDVYNNLILSDINMRGRQVFVEELESQIKKIYHDAKLTLFGSSVNKFGIKNSDLDICLTFPTKDLKDIDASKVLNRITKHLRKYPKYTGVFGLYSAVVPIVKFHYPAQKWNCDLSLYNVLAVHNSKLLSKYAMIDERCRILGCALKHLAMKGWIGDSASKSLSSYSYILMVIHYLQQTEPPVLPVLPISDQEVFVEKREIPKEIVTGKNYWFSEEVDELRKRYKLHPRNESSTAELWIGLIDYYLKYDRKYAVTITQKEPMLASDLQRFARLFNIEDPFLHKRNLGGVLSDEKAERTVRVLRRARLLFGHNISSEKIGNLQAHYFSTNNLTGQFGKEMECTSCGAFDHESENCLKANPFKKYNAKIQNLRKFPQLRKF